MNDFRFKTPIAPITADGTYLGFMLPPPPDETCGPDVSAPGALGRTVDVGSLRALGPSLFERLRALIADEMPTGEHRERAAAWRRLAARCLKTADKHEATAERREAHARTVRSFAPAYREHVSKMIAEGHISVTFASDDTLRGEGTLKPYCDNCLRVISPEELAGVDHYCGRAPVVEDPENGTWRPLTPGERSTRQVMRRDGIVAWLTEQEQRDNRTAEPPRWQLMVDYLQGED